jgi:type IV secretion system protein VirD4
MKRDSPKQIIILAAFGLIPVVWVALLAAPAVAGGLPDILQNLTAALNNPFHIEWCGDSMKTVLFFVAAYGMAIGIYFSTKRNTRPREEHGSAKWGEAAAVNRKYADKRFCENKILTQNVRIGFDARKHRRNLNVLVCGGSGAGKTRFYCKPNAMNCNTSMVILDPKGLVC